ncbi:helix-turn-helix domain-containing protein [Limoniibacter endophyticus]|uniref:XRE family transcriptional regulator n=1 Tax=Limoniibacter endophyticus TaxID=1565040 RepID=A0A8J3DRD6_9HYPH|nr:helix-turn-helix transcriptional regulator [Limoniibacter endophyticus]GHC79921.1 XRE family transcriptional regulator [Limoniibacter endophyticus]
MGPRLRRLRRDLGLTQADMAEDLQISSSYIALMERNQRPVTAEVLLRLARTYRLDMAEFAQDTMSEQIARLQSIMKDPIFGDIDFLPLEITDSVGNSPGLSEALLRLYTAYREEQLALADHRSRQGGSAGDDDHDPVAAVRNFLSARLNCFPVLDTVAERLVVKMAEIGSMRAYLQEQHGIRIRRLPSNIMHGMRRRFDRHRHEILLDDRLDHSSTNFQLAQQLSYLEFEREIVSIVEEARFGSENARRLAHRALGAYCAAAILMPYTPFVKAVDQKKYDIEALSRQFDTSFEQTAHRLTTLQKPGQERIPFFFLRVDVAGNVSKRLNSANFPFARHGGGCPLWTVHQVFTSPMRVVTQWLELPDGQRFFSVARTVNSEGGAFGSPRIERAIALVCEARHAERLIYHAANQSPATPIGIACRLCQRTDCVARAEPPIGRQILSDDYRRTEAPFGFSDS